MPGNFPETDAPTPLVLKALLSIVSPVTRPVTVKPVNVFVAPLNSDESEIPVTVALALLIVALVDVWLVML